MNASHQLSVPASHVTAEAGLLREHDLDQAVGGRILPGFIIKKVEKLLRDIIRTLPPIFHRTPRS